MTRSLQLATVTFLLSVGASAQTTAWINEIHYDNGSGDSNEFIEVVLPASALPDNYELRLYNGNGGSHYGNVATLSEFDGPPTTTTVSGYSFYVCRAGPGEELGGSIQDGAPDGMVLLGPDPLNAAYPLVHFLSYEGAIVATGGPDDVVGQQSLDIGVAEESSTEEGESLQLTGTGPGYESFTWAGPLTASPGQANGGQVLSTSGTIDATYSFGSSDDVAGFRQLGAAVTGIRVDDLAQNNLVQGILGAEGFEPQYPDANGTTEGSQGPNLYTAYDGNGYTVAPSTAAVLQLGRGFLWYLFDQRIDPDDGIYGGGTSESFPLPQTQEYLGYALSGDGTTEPDYVLAFDVVNGQTFFLLANPATADLDLAGITMRTAGATLQTTFQVYDPAGGYQVLTQGSDALAQGQGVWAEVTGLTTSAVTFGFDLDATTTGGVFQGRRALGVALDLRLDGVTAGGTTTVDGAARISLQDDGTDGWDRHDASKLTPLAAPYALVAPVGTRAGEPRRQAVRSAPVGPVTTDLAFTATEAGTYTLSADVPTGWAADLLDRATGATTDLATAPYTFDAGATGWTDRFELAVSPATTAAEEADAPIAEVGRPFPNPTAAGARLRVRVGATERVRVVVYDALGREAAVAFDGPLSGGADAVVSLPAGLRPGVYVVRVTGETFAQSRPLVVVR